MAIMDLSSLDSWTGMDVNTVLQEVGSISVNEVAAVGVTVRESDLMFRADSVRERPSDSLEEQQILSRRTL